MSDWYAAIPLGLYVHLPWCVQKCPYCDFNSHAKPAEVPERRYVEALLADLTMEAGAVQGRRIATIFIGGGTPSLFSGEAMQTLLDGIRARIPLAPAVEITLEANPGAVDAEHFARYRDAGVNRLSIGVQSLRAAQLKRLGRIHNPDDVMRAFVIARDAGFGNINLDLMHGLPGDRKGDSLRDLEGLLSFEPEHVSWYQLTIEPGTVFAQRPPKLPGHDRIAEEFDAGCALLAARGFSRYEVSAFTRPGRACRHNLNYWRFGDYIGIGAGAHGKVSQADGVLRSVKRRSPGTYMKSAGTAACNAESRWLVTRDFIPEFMLNALRLADGVERELFAARTGREDPRLAGLLAAAVKRGWLRGDPQRITPSDLGFRFLNDLQLLFIAGDNSA